MESCSISSSKKSLSADENPNKEIHRQVYAIAETILHIAKSVEEALVNITVVKEVLSRISHKLSRRQVICAQEKALLAIAEQWLQDEKIKPSADKNGKLVDINLDQLSALGTSLLSASTENDTGSLVTTPTTASKKFPNGSTQTLNDGAELDWDGNGVELVESIHSAYSGITSAFHNPYTLCASLIASNDFSGTDITQSTSYDGIYEEEMEFTLEVEEGFYSDSSFSDNGNNFLHPEDFSAQTDSGVTHLDSNTSTDHSMSHADDDFTMEASPSYNREINTWDTFANVNAEEDLLSTASSANNSNSSTPIFPRRRHKSVISPKSPEHTGNTNYSSQSLSVYTPQPTVEIRTPNSINSVQQISSNGRSRANSLGENRLNYKALSPMKRMFESQPKLIDDLGYLNGYTSTTNGQTPKSSFDEETSSSHSSKNSVKTSISAEGYSRPNVPLPSSLRKNNYSPRSRRPVFV